ncbi:ABC transporter permease [Agromyces sp. NBRC 114283]|uniref:ABC transporter permease n=1 Tax=Agromyces sp. NBRC 114283 TaxID=2994521 RepID=UPI0024A0990F|nr:ABC transporter permease [Agromyces sp. NBRC 114283]GLU89704.1 sugar ABC transporter permease [Agromyces sp. NBRC 114283]
MSTLTEHPPAPDAAPGALRRVWSAVADSNGWIVLVLAGLVLLFSVLAPGQFFTQFNLTSIAIGTSVILVIAVGQTFLIISGSFDLSVGSVLIFASVVSSLAMNAIAPTSQPLAIVVGLFVAVATGVAWGILNGVVVSVLRIPALITTLATMGIALGLAQVITNGTNVSLQVPLLTSSLGSGRLGPFPVIVLLAVAIAVVGIWLLSTTKFGRYSYAIGSNAEAARRVGIKVRRHEIAVFALTSGLAGLAAFMSVAQYGTTAIGGHTTDSLESIAGTILGGTSLFGGVGGIGGTIVGVLIPTVLKNGLIIVGLQPFWQGVAIGVVLIAAVFIDQLRRRRRNSM